MKKIAGWQSAHRLKRDGKVDPNTLWSIVTELRMRNQPSVEFQCPIAQIYEDVLGIS
ncbi:hypothetical protein [Microcoleus anatoxicus]|uniref:hypothetical protein n=1 Tax=Microcoleus anatoxicus TaxID=2705319 RepID=UPI003BF53B55